MTNTIDYRVSVVIPTNGRNSLHRAVCSALSQIGVDVDVIVAYNGTESVLPIFEDPRVRVIQTSPAGGANLARQTGIEAAQNEIIALLDDDDEWHPNKLGAQLLYLGRDALLRSDWVMSCGITIVDELGEILSTQAPRVFSELADDPMEYLFQRDSYRDPLRQLQSSTLVFRRSLALEVPFDANLKMHQDWTWVCEVYQKRNIRFFMVDEYLVKYYKSPGNSISSGTKSQTSISWALAYLQVSGKRVLGDFLVTIPVNLALQARDNGGACRALMVGIVMAQPGFKPIVRGVLAIGRSLLESYSALLRKKGRNDSGK